MSKGVKQGQLFDGEFGTKLNTQYTSKIKIPTYEPRGVMPSVFDLVGNSKTKTLINEIHKSNVSEEEKQFLIQAAQRHNVFNYELIADYYAGASKEMQHLMEHSALVIIDFNKAIQFGYVNLNDKAINHYQDEHIE